ncbi:transposase zinc-binding domain-containing protein [Pyxidicoccus xibeiensis]|uniref:transposase zinc-binding domain-containing protein n=1 Tax=Pyxidicoccus xibeiensis TaxID=2906759 RepID=UPI00389A5B1B
MLAHGFARVRCESCKDELLVAFSCKGRGVCPSCNAKRAHVTEVHLVERVLPHVPYRQWTLSFPHRVRWALLKDSGLLSDVLTVFLRALFALQRRRARKLGTRNGRCPGKGPRTRGRPIRPSPFSSASDGRGWTCGHRPRRCPAAPSWRASPSMPTPTCMQMTGRAWSGCAGTERGAPSRWSASRRQKTGASPTA